MTAEARKARNEAYLRSLDIPVNPGLPMIEGEDEVSIRSGADIARRLLILTYIAYAADTDDREETLAFLKRSGLWPFVSEDEKRLLTVPTLSRQESINISWKAECVWLMLWAVQRVDALQLPTEQCEVAAILDRLPGLYEDPSTFIESAERRSAAELLDLSDLIYRMHWAVRQAALEGESPPADLEPGVVRERHYAINWITGYDECAEWDDITTDT